MYGLTMDQLKAPPQSWAHDVQNYESEKRRVVDEGLVHNKQVRVHAGHVKLQERCFDPVLQRYRDNGTELQQRTLEEKERVGHLNRAQDISILRGAPFNVITHESKLEKIAPGVDPERMGHHKPRDKEKGRQGAAEPDSALDYNILSNIPQEHHHWARPERRPFIATKKAAERIVPAFLVKDFNIVSNRYLDAHEARTGEDHRLNILDSAKKIAKHSRFDPLSQQFNDPREEERSRTCDHARDVEIVMRAENGVPPTYKGRESAFYDVLSHQISDPEMIACHDRHNKERKERFKNRHIVEHNRHAQDLKNDHITESRKLNNIAPERYQEDKMRGYDVINNKRYGKLNHEKYLHEPSTRPRLTPWEKIEAGHACGDIDSAAASGYRSSKAINGGDVGYLDPAKIEGLNWADSAKGMKQQASKSAPSEYSDRRSERSGRRSERSGKMAASASAPNLRSPSQRGAPAASSRAPVIHAGEMEPSEQGYSMSERRPIPQGTQKDAQPLLAAAAAAGGPGGQQRSAPSRTPAPVSPSERRPPGHTAFIPGDGARSEASASSGTRLRSRDPDTLRQAGARTLGPSASAPQFQAASGGGGPGPAQVSMGGGATRMGGGATIRPGGAAPPAPVGVPGSPGGSVYSRRLSA